MMNDEDIKKALECCSCGVTKCVCNECPIRYKESCLDDLPKFALDLINRQQAEIEKFKKAINEADQYFSEGNPHHGMAVIATLAIELEKGGVTDTNVGNITEKDGAE